MTGYELTAERLKARILALIPTNPDILMLESPWGLWDIPGFNVGDVGTSYAQASWALEAAKAEWRKTPTKD
jgi:hypothetical protein